MKPGETNMGTAKIEFDFSDSKVLITGGTSGIGEATALAFAAAGAQVIISGRDEARATAILDRASNARGGTLAFIAGDITDSLQCTDTVNLAAEQLGGLDIVVNSAGILYHATVEATTDEQWAQTMNVNVAGVFYICRAAIPHLKPQGGCIVNIASDAALTGSEHLAAYCASKGAVLQLSRAMAQDHAADNIRVIPVCPGDVDTPMLRQEYVDRGLSAEAGLRESADAVPLKRVCHPEEVAHMVMAVACDSAAFMTGWPLVMDGGYRA
jgi:meso-butanediol dehydrogenase/(S,S)-butanediol dehydrogenase/diacetyl reductase